MTIGIAGAGRVAQALGRHLREIGEPVVLVASRSMEHATEATRFIGGSARAVPFAELHCDRMLIAVDDRAIGAIQTLCPRPQIAIHTSGAHSAELLGQWRARGTQCGSLHPLQTFATPEAGYRGLRESAFAVDGDAEALQWAESIARSLDGLILRIPAEFRAIYHAAAAMASNHITAVLDAASQMMQQAGISESDALHALGGISRAALNNTLERGPVAALTGPVERGDVQTVALHLAALRAGPASIDTLYRAASLQALDIAKRKGLDSEHALLIRAALETQHA